jgi:hypothetical protein
MRTTKYSTELQAQRMGLAEAIKLTNRGYPTTLMEVRQARSTIMAKDYTMGNQHFDWTSQPVTETKWEAVLS